MSIMTFLRSIVKFIDGPSPIDPPCSCGVNDWDIEYEQRDDRWHSVAYGVVVTVRVGTCRGCGLKFDLS